MVQARFPESDFGDFYSVAQISPSHLRLQFEEDSFPGVVSERDKQSNISRDGIHESESPLVVADIERVSTSFSVNTNRVTAALLPRPIEMRPDISTF